MERNIVITADSTCDIGKELTEKYGVVLIPLYAVCGDKAYSDGVDITPEDIYKYVEESGNLPKTSAVPVGGYEEKFREIVEKGNDIVHISISNGFSSSYNNARLAAESVGHVEVVDSLNLSTGSAHCVIIAAELAKEGLGIKEIKERLDLLTDKVDASFILDNLSYLRMGGRCSSVAVLGANLLKLKPCIEVIDGKMEVGKKYRGSFESCLKNYIKDRLEGNQDDIDAKRIFVTHTKCNTAISELAKQEIAKYMNFDEIIETEAGCTINCHCGPNTIGILYMRKSKKTK